MKKFSILLVSLLLFCTAHLVADELIKEGEWERIDYRVRGKWQIVKKSDGFYVLVDKDFKTRSGPDLHILFSSYRVSKLTDIFQYLIRKKGNKLKHESR